LKSFNFVEIIFIFFGIYEQFREEQKVYEILAKSNSITNECGVDVVDYKGTPEPKFVKLYGDLLSQYIINSSNHSAKDAMVLCIKWMKTFLAKESIMSEERMDLIESILHQLIYDIENNEVKLCKSYDSEELDVDDIEQLEIKKWCQKINLKEIPREFLPTHELDQKIFEIGFEAASQTESSKEVSLEQELNRLEVQLNKEMYSTPELLPLRVISNILAYGTSSVTGCNGEAGGYFRRLLPLLQDSKTNDRYPVKDVINIIYDMDFFPKGNGNIKALVDEAEIDDMRLNHIAEILELDYKIDRAARDNTGGDIVQDQRIEYLQDKKNEQLKLLDNVSNAELNEPDKIINSDVDKKTKNGKPLSPTQINKIEELMGKFEYAVEHGADFNKRNLQFNPKEMNGTHPDFYKILLQEHSKSFINNKGNEYSFDTFKRYWMNTPEITEKYKFAGKNFFNYFSDLLDLYNLVKPGEWSK